MTLKELFEHVLIDVKKEQSPHLHLREFNFILNETISEFVDDVWFAFETNQKTTDYLKPLKRFKEYTHPNIYLGIFKDSNKVDLPEDYRHISAVKVGYEVVSQISDACYSVGTVFEYPCKKTTADQLAMIEPDPFQRPKYHNPYFSILGDELFLHTGKHVGIDIKYVFIEYIKQPEILTLTYQQAFQDTIDTSQVLEFTREGAYKIKDKLVVKMLEKDGSPRLKSYYETNLVQPPQDTLTNIRTSGAAKQ